MKIYVTNKIFNMAITDKHIAGETFWLNIAAENIYSTFEKRATSVKNLKLVIEWAFRLFLTGGFVLSIFGSIENFNLISLVLFGIAFFFLTASYALASQAQYPVTKEYHPNDVSDISIAFSSAVKTQADFFKWAAGMTLTGFFFLALAILFLFYKAKKPPEVVKITVNPLLLRTSIEKKEGNYFIPVSIMTLPDSKIDLTITGVKDGENNVLYTQPFLADTTGRISYSYPLTTKEFDTFFVRAGIQESEAETTIERFTTVKIIRK